MDDDFLTVGHFTVFSQVSGRYFSSKDILMISLRKKFPAPTWFSLTGWTKVWVASGGSFYCYVNWENRDWFQLPHHISAYRGRSSCILLYVILLTETSEWGVDIWIDFEYNLGKGRNHLGLLVHSLGHYYKMCMLKKETFTFFFLVTRRNAEDFFFSWSLATMSRHICPSVVAFTQQFFKFLLDLWRHQ